MLGDFVNEARVDSGDGLVAARLGGLMIDFRAEVKPLAQLARHRRPERPRILPGLADVDRVAATAEPAPRAEILLQPDRQEEPTFAHVPMRHAGRQQ